SAQINMSSNIGTVVIGPDNSIYFTDTANFRIRKIDPNGTISTIAGNGTQGFDGDGGPAILARISQPVGIFIANDGGFYFADSSNNRIRRISVDGMIATVAGNGSPGSGSNIGDNG